MSKQHHAALSSCKGDPMRLLSALIRHGEVERGDNRVMHLAPYEHDGRVDFCYDDTGGVQVAYDDEDDWVPDLLNRIEQTCQQRRKARAVRQRNLA